MEVDVLNLDENVICMTPDILLQYTSIYSFE